MVPGLVGSKFSYQHRQRGQCSGYFNQAGRDPRRSGEKNSCKKAEKANQTRRRVLQCSEIVPAQTSHPARSGTRAAADTRSDPDGAQLQRAEKAAAGGFPSLPAEIPGESLQAAGKPHRGRAAGTRCS